VVRSFVRGGRRLLVVGCSLVVLAAIGAPIAGANGPASLHPVPSLQPKLTQQLWTKLVHRRHVLGPNSAAANCRSLRAVFYTESDWLRLATKLAANASPCAQYYISIPPLAANKTNFRPDQPWRIRALGPNFHVLAEISYNGWNKWVTDNASNWHDAGVEARRRMAAQGFDVAAGDSWVVNEFSSGVRGNIGDARQKVRDLVRGLYEGDGTVPQVKGAVYLQGIGQPTTDLGSYKVNLQNWYLDTPFWQDMSAYVSDWSQELYGDVRDYGVAGASPADRAAHLEDFLGHQLTLANVAPPEAATARTFLQQTYNPLANAAWIWQSGFGFTDTPLLQMQDFVSAQTYALRTYDVAQGLPQDRFGFAWAPRMADNSAWTPDFNAQSAQLIDRLAAAIHDSDQAPGGACGTAWCNANVDGAAFVETWKTFTAWSQPALGFTTPPATTTAGAASTPLTVQLQTAGVAENAAAPLTVALSSSSATGSFAPSADGPWTSTLDVPVAAGASSATFYYEDTKAGSATITASTAGRQPAAQVETIAAGALASLAVTPASASLAVGAPQMFTAAGTDAYGNAVAPTVTWSATGGTLSTTSGASTAYTATTPGQGSVTATSGTVTSSAAVNVTGQPKSRVSSIAYSRSSSTLFITFTAVGSSGHPLSGASIGLRILRNGASYATGTAHTASNGKATVSVRTSRGCYSTTVTSMAATGITWDGVTPSNSYCY
jgi:hypothetical protein